MVVSILDTMDGTKRPKLNQDKTELRMVSSSYLARPGLHDQAIVNEIVSCCLTGEGIGVVIDGSVSMVSHITIVYKSPSFHLRN